MKNSMEEFLDRGGVIQEGGVRIMGRETYLLSIGYTADGKPASITARFGQGKWWNKKDGNWIAIADMSPGHRYNSAAMLMRTVHQIALRHAFAFGIEAAQHDGGDMAHDSLEQISDELFERANNDPRAWLRSTTLYRALTDGLTIQGDGTEPWQKTGRDPVTGGPTEVPPPMTKVCEIPACGCSGEAHP